MGYYVKIFKRKVENSEEKLKEKIKQWIEEHKDRVKVVSTQSDIYAILICYEADRLITE